MKHPRHLTILLCAILQHCVLSERHSHGQGKKFPDFTDIPSGRFLMGTSDAKPLPRHVSGGLPDRIYGSYNERPVLEHSVDSFEMSKTEITNEMYEQFDPEHRNLRGKLYFSHDDDEAAIWLSWHNATDYAAWLTKARNDGYEYRLPTEIEWEYACRAGTTTAYNTGDKFPSSQRRNNFLWSHDGKNPEEDWPENMDPSKTSKLHVGLFPPNKFGLHDMHGNVEEWTSTIYKEYGNETSNATSEMDTFYVSRGGSHGTALYFLRSSARFGAPAFANNMAIGLRVVRTKARHVSTHVYKTEKKLKKGGKSINAKPTRRKLAPEQGPYFRYIQYVNIPENQTKFPYGRHNHDPAIVNCPDGSLLAIFFSTWHEKDREQGLASTRLHDTASGSWTTPVAFYNTPARVNTAPAFLSVDGGKRLYQWMAVSPWESNKGTQVYQRESTDCGLTWSTSQVPKGLDYYGHHSPAETALELSDGTLLLPTDDSGTLPEPSSGPHGGKSGSGEISRFCLSSDKGKTWTKQSGAIRGHHGAFVELKNSSIWGIGRYDGLVGKDGLTRMAQGLTNDRGNSYVISATQFPNIHSGQRMVSLRLKEGPIIVVSFANGNATGVPSVYETRHGTEIFGMFVAMSFDEAKTFPVVRLVSDDASVSHPVESSDGEIFQMNRTHGEPRGYISAIQDQNTGIIHTISSRQHYQFNYDWLMAK
jgi:formylglycine-generating enzyme